MSEDALTLYRARLTEAAASLARTHARRRRRLAAAGVAAAMLIAVTGTLAATGVVRAWLGGEPAPAEVQQDFAGIRPELGYHPEPGKAAVVAADGDAFVLYATPMRGGGYCLVARVPWLGFDGDGRGYCAKEEIARAPLVAGVIGGSRDTWVVAGRVTTPGAVGIAFANPRGQSVERRLGAGGFFVAAVQGTVTGCFEGAGWWPELVVSGTEGRELARARFPFWIPARSSRGERVSACGSVGLMSDETAARIIRSETK